VVPGAEEPPGAAGPGVPSEIGGPRRRLREARLRAHRVHPRYSDTEFALLEGAAKASRMKIGGYVAEASLAAARAEDPTAGVADYRALIKSLMAANRQLAGVGNNLNQLTWHLNKDGPWPADETVGRLLNRVEAAIAEVDVAIARVTER
jgi:hypothetical protein